MHAGSLSWQPWLASADGSGIASRVRGMGLVSAGSDPGCAPGSLKWPDGIGSLDGTNPGLYLCKGRGWMARPQRSESLMPRRTGRRRSSGRRRGRVSRRWRRRVIALIAGLFALGAEVAIDSPSSSPQDSAANRQSYRDLVDRLVEQHYPRGR